MNYKTAGISIVLRRFLLLVAPGAQRAVQARFNDEAITVQNWPAQEGHIVVAEFHY